MPLTQVQIGQVIQIDGRKYVKISRDKYLAAEALNLQTFTCGAHSTLTAANTCTCDSGYYYSNSGVQTHSVDGGSCSYIDCLTYNNTLDSNGNRYVDNVSSCNYYQTAAGSYELASNCDGTLSGGFCWDTLDSNTYTWTGRNNGCDSGFTVPTKDQFNTYISRMGSGNQIYQAWGLYGYYWSSTESNSSYAYSMDVNSGSAGTLNNNKTFSYYVRCIK